MGVRLREVPAAAGVAWIRQGFAAFRARPAVFLMLLAGVMLSVLVLLALPLIGPVLVPMTFPVISLLFMMATAWSLAADPGHRRLAATPFAAARHQRQGLVGLAALYATATIAIGIAANALGGDALHDFLAALTQAQNAALAPGVADAGPAEVVFPEPSRRALATIVLMYGGLSAVSLAMWHAPGLVHWGGQGAAQALFSNALALWRTRAAFMVYVTGWTTIGLSVVMVSMLLAALGLGAVAALLLLPASFAMLCVFYVSTYFSFIDTFEVE